jgi:hypothetical protein
MITTFPVDSGEMKLKIHGKRFVNGATPLLVGDARTKKMWFTLLSL